MTDAEYWSIANALPKTQIYQGSTGYVWNLDWRSALPGCDQTQPLACSFVRGWNPITNCWVDPGAQYVTPPSPYPSPSSWGVPLCNPPITQPPPSGSGGTTTGGGGGGTTFPACGTVFMVDPNQISLGVGEDLRTNGPCKIPSNYATCKATQILVSGKTWTKYDCTSQTTCPTGTIKDATGACVAPGGGGIDTSAFSSIPTWVYVATAGALLFFFMKR